MADPPRGGPPADGTPGDDPFGALPPQLRALFDQLGGPEAVGGLAGGLGGTAGWRPEPGATGWRPEPGATGWRPEPGATPSGPVDWQLATRVALTVAVEDDRSPTDAETTRAHEALQLAEHWLDATALPAPPDAGRLVVASRQTWVNVAVVALRPLVEPVAQASTDAMAGLAEQQLGELEEGDLERLPGFEQLPPQIAQLVSGLGGEQIGAMLRPAGAALAGLQAGQVIGQLARQLLGQYELGVPTAPRPEAHHLAANVAETFEGWQLDPTEVAIVLALHEAAHRRLYHAIPWLEDHLRSLVSSFAAGTVVDPERLQQVSEELMLGVDPEDPEALAAAMERATEFRLQPTAEQRRVLERPQSVVGLVGAWARAQVVDAAGQRLPGRERIEEVLRRRRAVQSDGEALLASLLGLDLKPDDETVAERFVAEVTAALGPEGLRRALAHPENLPDASELADPGAWLARTTDETDVPDDPSSLFGGLDDAPVEASGDERRVEADHPDEDDDPPDAEDPGSGPDPGR